MRRIPIGLLCSVVLVAASAHAQTPAGGATWERPSAPLAAPSGESRFETSPTVVGTVPVRPAGADGRASGQGAVTNVVPGRRDPSASAGTLPMPGVPDFETAPKPVRTVPVR